MKVNNTLITDFTEGNVIKLLLSFSAPLFFANFLQVVYNMVDMIVVGHFYGSVGLSAVSIGGDISNFLTFIAMGFSNAGQVIIAQYVGAGQKEKVGRFVGTMFAFLLFCALVLSVICIIFRDTILIWMNTPEQSWQSAMDYATTCMVGLVFIYGYNIVSAVMRGIGDSKHPFVFISIAAVLNLVLDILFVGVFHMGSFGAALATVIGQTASFIFAMIFIYKKRKSLGFELQLKYFIKIDTSMLKTLVNLGIPMAIKSAAIHFSKIFVSSWVNSYGIIVSAVAGIANKFNSISNLFSNAVNTAGSSMVGQNIGAEKYKRVPKIMLTSFCITLSISLCLICIVLLAPKLVFGIFTKEEAVINVCLEYLPVAILIFLGSSFRAPMNALVNGSGNHKINFAVALLDGIVLRIGLAIVLGLVCNMGYLGFWYGDALAGFTPFFIGTVYFLTGKWKTRKYVISEK